MTAIPAWNQSAVKKRSGGICEGCSRAPAEEIHHRQFKSRGGTHDVANLIHLCGWGNHTGCHGEAHAGARGESVGWSVRSRFDPELVPVFRRSDSSWWRFDNDGGKQQIHPIDAVEYLRLIGAIREGLAG